MSMINKQHAPVPYASMMRKLASEFADLQDELAAESQTNIDFEETSRTSFERLDSQVQALKAAFGTLADSILEELESFRLHIDDGFEKHGHELKRVHTDATDKYTNFEEEYTKHKNETAGHHHEHRTR